jgi:3-dehydroquinate dehydratase II
MCGSARNGCLWRRSRWRLDTALRAYSTRRGGWGLDTALRAYSPRRGVAAIGRLAVMTSILVLNGPNLGRLGSREPEVYGTATLAELEAAVRSSGAVDVTIDFRQTDDEAELVRWLHDAVDAGSPVVLNPAAFTHYSYALRDAAALVTKAGLTLIEVHLSNPHSREVFRHTSVLSGVATGVIAGFGVDSYLLALEQVRRIVG